jgi:hypothetical protein
MVKSTLFSAILGALFVVGLAIAPAHAQATRTWISGVGDDANPCSRTAPCKTFAGAISKTSAGGEIDALDPGGFGTLTITKSITLDGGGGQVASVLASGTPGINIVANQTTDNVIIRNLRFNGLLPPSSGQGTNGIQVTSAARVVIEKCEIFGFALGAITVTPSSGTTNVKIQETTVNSNGAGISVKPTGGTVNVAIERTRVDNNVNGGLRIDGTAGGAVNAAITDSSISLNGGNGLNALSGTANVAVDVERVVFGENGGIGVNATNANGGTSTVTVGSSMLSYNTGGAWGIGGTATLLSFKNNQVTGTTGATPGTGSFQ